jgi:MYXO-CTERM domain-containing protein
MMRRWYVGALVAASVCLGSGVAWACPASAGWVYVPGEGVPECLEVVVSNNPGDGGITYGFENGCVGEVTLDATRCDACSCEVGCETPGPIAPGEAVEVTLSESTVDGEREPLELQIGLVVYDAEFENGYEPCGASDEGCAVAGAQAPARRAPWGGLVVVLGLWGWRRRRG